MRTRSTTIMIAATLATGLTLNAQTPSPQTPTTPQTPQTRPQTERPTTSAAGSEQTVTLAGCLKEEKDVPGRTPNVAERAGMGEDYILTNVKMGQGSSTSAMGLQPMYQVKGIDDTELKKHLNHQVEVVGRISGSASGSNMGTGGRTGATGTTGTGTTGTTGTGTTGTTGTTGQRTGAGATTGANSDLPELQATSIRMVAATCPAQ